MLTPKPDIDPRDIFVSWYGQAEKEESRLPNIVALATADQNGVPSVRFVLYKGFGDHDSVDQGLRFFTNMESAKAHDLGANPRAEIAFYWDRLHRQVRIAGPVSALDRDDVAEYFKTRPRASQLGAWVSPQSQAIPSREYLEERIRELAKEFQGRPVPVPKHWGGYSLKPEKYEFWVGNDQARLHDRFLFRRNRDSWEMSMLAP